MDFKTKGCLLAQAGKGYAPVVEKHNGRVKSKKAFYAELEQFAREKIGMHLQDLLGQEVSERLRSAAPVDDLGTIEIERPRGSEI